jgi:hypothetical protein
MYEPANEAECRLMVARESTKFNGQETPMKMFVFTPPDKQV